MAKTDTEHRSRLGLKRTLILILCAAAVLAIVFFLGMHIGGQEEEGPVITSDLLGQQLRSVQELVSVEYRYTNMGKFQDQIDFYGWDVPFTTKSFIVSYDGVIKAGVDLSQAQVEVSEAARTVTITLPESQILSHEIFEDSIEVFDETNNIFNQITIEDYTGFTQDQKEVVTQKAIDNGLLTAADEKAQEAVEALLTLLPGMDAYTLTVK